MLWMLTGEQYSPQCSVDRYPSSFNNSKICSFSCLPPLHIPGILQKQNCWKFENVIQIDKLFNTAVGTCWHGKWLHHAFTEKYSDNLSCTFASNEIANNSNMSCCKIVDKGAISRLNDNSEANSANKTKIVHIQTKKKMWKCQLCLKDLKYAAKDKKEVLFISDGPWGYWLHWEGWLELFYHSLP